MSSTPRRPSAKWFGKHPRGRRPGILPLRFLLPIGLASISSGCSTPGQVHPEFERLRPSSVAVLPVKNETIHQLDQVVFGGLLQRTFIGAKGHDVPEVLRAALEEALVRKGYTTLRLERPEDAAATPDAPGALLHATIESWHGDTGGSFSMRMRYRLAMRGVPGGEVLYSGTFKCEEGGEPGARRGQDPVRAISLSARRALAALPASGPAGEETRTP